MSDCKKSPIKFEIMMSMDSYVVQNFKTQTLADLLIDISGIARSFYFIGMLCAIVTSKILYQRDLIQNLFLYQKPAKRDTNEINDS